MKKNNIKFGFGALVAIASFVIVGVSSAAAPQRIGGISFTTFCATYAQDAATKSFANLILNRIHRDTTQKGKLIRQYATFKSLGKQYCKGFTYVDSSSLTGSILKTPHTGAVASLGNSAGGGGGGYATTNTTDDTTTQKFTAPSDYFTPTIVPPVGITQDQTDITYSRIDRAKQLYANIVDDFVSKGRLQSADRDSMVGKVGFQLSSNCNELDGKILVRQWFDSNHNPLRNELVNLSITINLCFQPSYEAGYDTFLKKIIYHELGHYLDYFHDTNDAEFKNLCWSGTTSTCNPQDFITQYAGSSSDEDYAESFSYYVQDGSSVQDSILQQKIDYFSHKFPK